MAKGGFANSKDSDQRQTSFRKAKKPKSTRWFIQWEKRPTASFIRLDWATMTERSTTQYQTSPRITLLSKETLSTNEEVLICVDRKKENLPVDLFITSLSYWLPEHCNYRDLHDEMIWDHIVVAYEIKIYQRDYKLIQNYLDKAITMARQTEAVREQQADTTCTRIEAIEHSYSNKKLRTMF